MSSPPESSPSFEDLLLEVLGLDPDEQRERLRGIQDRDPGLADRLSRALSAEVDTWFLESPEVDTAPEKGGLPDLAGTRVGSSRLLRPLGEGGMGVVYEAEQPEMRRRVAVKLMKGLLSREARLRFEYEVRFLGGLRHPGIAQVYESGVLASEAGELPWFTMEFIEDARPLNTYAEEEALSLPQRLALVATVCDAVHYAHQRGVIHRDLKPANVVVDAAGQVKVIDFGLARGLEEGDETRGFATVTGAALGTLRYMSPEQARGRHDEVDVRTDVYALGVMLYQLVCGRHPLIDPGEDPSVADYLLAIEQRPAHRPSRAVPHIHEDLEAILLTALAKEPDRRFAGAAALAEDLRAHLHGDPVSARSPTRAERLRHFVRHNRALTVAAGITVVALVTAAVVSTVFAIQAERARTAERRRADEAERRLGASRRLASWVTGELQEELARIDGTIAVREELVRRVIEDLDAAAKGEEDAAVLYTIAMGFMTAGVMQGSPQYPSLGKIDAALETLAKAQAFADRSLAARPDDRNTLGAALMARAHRGDVLLVKGELDEAEALHREVVTRLAPLLEEDPPHRGFLRLEEQGRRGLSLIARTRAEPEGMIVEGGKAAAAARRQHELDPEDVDLARRAASQLSAHFEDLRLAGRFDDAETVLDEAFAILEPFEDEDSAMRLAYADLHRSRGDLLESQEEFEAALRSFRKAARAMKKILEENPRNATLAHHYSTALIGVGNMAWRLRRPETATSVYQENLALRREIAAITEGGLEQRYHLAYALTRVLLLYFAMRDLEKAEPPLREADALIEALMKEAPASTLSLAVDVKKAWGHLHRFRAEAPGVSADDRKKGLKEAVAAYQRALDLMDKHHPGGVPPLLQGLYRQIENWIRELRRETG